VYRLLRAAEEAKNPIRSRNYVSIVQAIEDDHIEAAKDVIKDPNIIAQYTHEVQAECDDLVKILDSAQHLEEVSSRSENKIISKGEKLSARFMVAVLQDQDVPAQFVDLSNVLQDYDISSARDRFYLDLAEAFAQEVYKCGDRVPVITGYFASHTAILALVGRGYSDLAASLVAVGIKAKELQILKEVDGVFTADPRKVPTSRLIERVSPSEAAELTSFGSEVVHPFVMDHCVRAEIPILIKNVLKPK
jgi:aspartate kinase